MLPEKIIFLSVIFGLIGQTLYIKSILKGETKPNLVSWGIWMLAPFIGVFFQWKAKAGLSSLPIFMSGFGPLCVFIVAILTQHAIWKIRAFDLVCGAFSLIALIIYVLTHHLGISILFAILSDLLAWIPTFVKTWKNPESESVTAYSYSTASNIVGLLIIKDWVFINYSFGLYLVVGNIAQILILYRKKIFR